MTTREAEQRYLAQHIQAHEHRKNAVYNPHDKPLDSLPVIWGFNNGGPAGLLHAVAIADDGTVLGGHGCSAEGYMPADLGILEGTRSDRHDTYRAHYPAGYRMEFVPRRNMETHERLQRALARHAASSREE